jgi:Protein of unknown function (DUF4058)
MAYRFPGMNPYLEQPALWPEVHKRLIVALADELNPLLNPTYRVAIEEQYLTEKEESQWYLKIYCTETKAVITIIKFLAHEQHLNQQFRDPVLNSKTHLIEIDLLRRNQPMPLAESTPQTPGTYRILISRSDDRPQALLYEFGIRQPIPTFVMPLADTNTPEPLVAIQQLIEGLYDRAGFDMDIDYSQQPTPSLGDEDWQWSQQLTSPTIL